MRRRDVLWACLIWGGLLAGLMWALSTQLRWIRENKPIEVQRPADAEAPAPAHEDGTRVIGTVGDDTLAAMGKGLKPKVQPQGPPQGKAPARGKELPRK